jgi:acylphosphatase
LQRNARLRRGSENFGASATILRSVNSAQQARRYFVSGGVQGVGFRYFTQHAAEKLHVRGYVRNLRDGRVEAFACGTAEQLAQFRAQLERGPRFASVREVQEQDAALDERYLTGFVITHED